ncbi:MAG: ACP S-malonyltransferase [Alphaproteobacteria bacterium]
MKAFLFPGQGSQTPGMGVGFMEDAATKHLFELADETLGMNLSRLMREGPEDDLRLTHNAQPALLVAGYAAAEYVRKATGKTLNDLVTYMAGHSLGEYTAVAAAGGVDLPTALRMVRLRGEAMTRAVPAGQGGMAAVMGLSNLNLAAFAKASASQAQVFMANDNAEGQMILSGTLEGLAWGEELAKSLGARKVIRLNVAGPFHTPAMKPAAAAVEAFLAEHPLKPLAVPVVMNATASVAQNVAEVERNLVAQITQPVRWRESMVLLAEQGVTQVAELGVGKVLSGLAGRCDSRLAAVALESPKAVDGWLEQLA